MVQYQASEGHFPLQVIHRQRPFAGLFLRNEANEVTALERTWQSVQNILKESMSLTVYTTFIQAALKPLALKNEVLYLAATADFYYDIVVKKYVGTIKAALFQVAGRPMDVQVLHPKEVEAFLTTSALPVSGAKQKLNPKYTFDTFIVGSNNRFAHAASLAVAEAPATSYNPLFLYGGVGLGKTHLMHAMGHYILDKHPDTKLEYVTSEQFTTELVTAIQTNKNQQFREKYRNVDVLMIDDIQFIAGRESTQEEFFHTFNALHGAGKQIVICSDRPPNEIAKLEERLSSRFGWGLIADIQRPDVDTRVAILKAKAVECNMQVQDDVLEMIAQKVDSNIRELEGTLTRLNAYANLVGQPQITQKLAEEALKEVFQEQAPRQITVQDVLDAVCGYYAVSREDILGAQRSRNISIPRQMVMYLARKLTDASLPMIGQTLGGRDHSTVMHGCAKIEELMQSIPTVRAAQDDLSKMLQKRSG